MSAVQLFPMAQISLKPGREKSVLRRHPWIFSGAVAELSGSPEAGETIEIVDSRGNWLARGAYNPSSQIRVRIWTWDKAEQINADFFARRVSQASELRKVVVSGQATNAYRMIYAESDGIPGLIVDRYADTLVAQFLSAGVERWRQEIITTLDALGAAGIYERSDLDVRNLEGLQLQKGLLAGAEPPQWIEIQENSIRYLVDVRNGHKTGFYLDQRDNRKIVSKWANGREVLDCFCYTGGFTLAAIKGGATRITSVDSAANVLELVAKNLEMNNASTGIVEVIDANVFLLLRKFRDQGRKFDMVILDPPKFAIHAHQVDKAARAYKDINLLALKLLRPGGILVAFSCSGAVDMNLFEKIVAGAALDAQVEASFVGQLFQSSDHPVAAHYPEGRYLKGLICYVK